MNSFNTESLPPSYFDQLYTQNPDPWQFETSEYEANKYAATIAALPRTSYESVLEIGCSIGVLTAKLAEKAENLLSIDVSELALQKARQRCINIPQINFQLMRIPHEFPTEIFDLIVVSEVGYYWSWDDMYKAQQQIIEHLQPGGHLLLVHWTLFARDYPLSGDEVHESFLRLTPHHLQHLQADRQEQYRLDLFRRV